MIIEKAWAKLHLCYQQISQGHAYEVFRDLLGAPSFYYKVNEDYIWDVIYDSDKKNYIISATAAPDLNGNA